MDPSLSNFAARYGFVDRLLHRLAFSLVDMQLDLSAREDNNNRAQLDAISAGPPVFVTALPRAGTTLLLDVLSRAPEFAAHTYRDMPFLFCPLTWQAFSGRFRREAAETERAHGDGLRVGLDSVEAFEEAFWLHFWPDHYDDQHISLWSDTEQHAAFEEFFAAHMSKIILKTRNSGKPGAKRYLSKNNANIFRTGWIKSRYPEAILLVPFRNPAAQIASMLRQHRNFSELHQHDQFSARYMADLGHFEFGHLHKPIRFPGASSPEALSLNDADYWARLWISAYQHLLDRPADELLFIDFDDLCTRPAEFLPVLARAIGLQGESVIGEQVGRFHPPVKVHWSDLRLSPETQERAEELHLALQGVSNSSAGHRPELR